MCLDTAKGDMIWVKKLPGATAKFRDESSLASSTPTTDGTLVYAAFWDGKEVHIVSYDFAGNQKWHKNLGRWTSQHGPGGSPILHKDKLIFANDMDFEDKAKNPVSRPSILYAFNKETGDIVWETPREAYRACYSAPFLLERNGQTPELIVTSSTAITSYNPDDGKPNWTWHWKWTGAMPYRTICSTLHVDGMLFACSGEGGPNRHMSAIDLKVAGKGAKPETVWENRKKFPYVSCLLSRGENLYFVNDDGYAGCFHAKSGKQIWFERLESANFHASPVLVDGKMIAVSVQGDVYVFAAEPTYQLLGKSSLGELVRASPAVADGRMYIRGQRHLYCIGKKEVR